MGGLGCLHFGDMLDNLWALLGAVLRGLSQGAPVLSYFHGCCSGYWLLLAMTLFYSLINGFLIVQVIAVVCGSELSSRSHSTSVGLLLG